MSEQIQETLADVLAEMRNNKGFPVPFAPDWSRAVCTTDLVEYADRIEAAAKRERAKIEADALIVGGMLGRRDALYVKKENGTMNNIDETELERRRSAAHRVEVIEEAVGGALLMAAAAALMWLYCKATPAQLSGESDWSAGVEARTEPRHALPMVTLSENGGQK